VNSTKKFKKCVILCGGKGTRLMPLSLARQKTLIEVKSKPIISYVIDYWQDFVDEFIFVVKFKKESLMDYINTLGIKATFVEPEELNGIADGISYVEKLIDDKFVVVLGDCIVKGEFNFPDNMEQGVGVWQTSSEADIKQSYSVEIEDNLVKKVVEKPKELFNDLCGLGFYFFDRRVFEYIRQMQPSALRNEKEITDCIGNMISAGEEISPVYLDGQYINISCIDDLKKAEQVI